jgi:F-type H+-transporting ATPase subunit epsilon
MAYDLTIVTPAGEAFAGSVASVVLPGSEGDFGVLAGHERFLSPLRAGEVEVQADDGTIWAAISGGFADVSGQQVVVLAETCELAADIDVARAERARERAEGALGRLSQANAEEAEFKLHQAALSRAVVRIQAAAHIR